MLIKILICLSIFLLIPITIGDTLPLNNPSYITTQEFYTWCNVLNISIDHNFMLSIAIKESSLNIDAESSAGAQGLFQFMPITLHHIKDLSGLTINPFSPAESLISAEMYMKWLATKVYTTTDLLIAWNWGIGNLWSYQAGEKTIPEETQNFVDRVFNRYKILTNNLLPEDLTKLMNHYTIVISPNRAITF